MTTIQLTLSSETRQRVEAAQRVRVARARVTYNAEQGQPLDATGTREKIDALQELALADGVVKKEGET